MLLAKVIGTVVSSRKDPKVEGFKFLVLQTVNPETMQTGGYVVAADAVGAGVGEFVLYASGSSARQTVQTKDRPVDTVIMAIIDSWDVEGERKYDKYTYDAGYGDALDTPAERAAEK